jgi:general L-amino acid transport system permease protein
MTATTPPSGFVRGEMIAPAPPPRLRVGAFDLIGGRLFSSVGNATLTVLGVLALAALAWPTVRFLLIDAVWHGTERTDCLPERVGHEVGACWPFIAAKFDQLMYGFYPADQRWRVNLVYGLGALALAPLLVPRVPYKSLNAALFFGVFPVVAAVLLLGGMLGLQEVETRLWGGLLVTLVISYAGIVGSLPLGILLALGRRSELPVVRSASVVFIEFWRGVPLITVLFFATYMLPLFVPAGFTVDGLVRVLIGIALFSGAYNAEVIRGGLQAIPRGQSEAASALGLSYWKTTGLIVMPQALRHVIPGLVNSFIALFKDTSLVSIVALFDLLGSLRASFSDPVWATPTTAFTGFAFTGMIYFVFCFGMSRYSLFVEHRLNAFRRN